MLIGLTILLFFLVFAAWACCRAGGLADREMEYQKSREFEVEKIDNADLMA
jgi:hypothetical protein